MTKIERAIAFASRVHEGMKRKGKDRPYILHPLEAMVVVAGMTDDPDVIAAAVLHDTVEDTDVTPEDIRREFGPRVEALVMAESEDKMRDLPPERSWQLRKEAAISRLEREDRDAKLICLGDKLSNLREVARDYALLGEDVWKRFHQKDKAKHAWYYRSMGDILEKEFGPVTPVREYRELLEQVFGEKAR